MFRVKEIFYSLQGEGHYAGTPSVFCRFTGCNKWSGRPGDRSSSSCPFCDTDFVGGDSYSEDDLLGAIVSAWPGGGRPRVVMTGGEPTLQLTPSLLRRLRKANFNVAIETNGSNALPEAGPYWVTVSPKEKGVVVTTGHEIKVLWPNPATDPADFIGLNFSHFYIQPIDDANYESNLRGAVEYVLANPKWKLSIQQHKIVGLR